MSRAPEVVVIGGGANGLTAAAFLARAGKRVTLVEARPVLGGTSAATVFHGEHASAGLHHETGALRPWIIERLSLERHGLRLRAHPSDVVALSDEGALTLPGDPSRALERNGDVSERDVEAYERMRELIAGIEPLISAFFDEPPIDWLHPERVGWRRLLREGSRLRRIGRPRIRELLRVLPMPARDWLREQFESERLAAALALPALIGTNMGPRSPGSCANLLLHLGSLGGPVEGGAPALVRALELAARQFGVDFRTSSRVSRVLLDNQGATGVELADGERIEARNVVASCDPCQALLELVPPGILPSRLERRLLHWRRAGRTACVLLALSRPVRWSCGGEPEAIRIAGSLDELERAHDQTKYRRMAPSPVLDVRVLPVPSNSSPSSANGRTLSVLAHFVPYTLEGGWSERRQSELVEGVVCVLERHAPDLRSAISDSLALSPPEIERVYGVSGGHLHHGELALDQMLVRPAPECHGYRTPIPGLWLCGPGTHPGFGSTCSSGALAAAAILG